MNVEHSCADFLSFVAPKFGDTLLSSNISERINIILSEIPALSLINLEFRLEAFNDRTDTNILIRQYEIPLLEKYISGRNGPAYAALKKWCRDWQNPDLPFKCMIPHIWIMFDVEPESEVQSEPWIILSFQKLDLYDEVFNTLVQKFTPYFTDHTNDLQWKLLEKIMKAKPEGGFVPALGIQNRKPPSLRTGVKPFYTFDEIEKYLKAMDWDGDMDVLRNAYAPFIELASYTMLSLTFNEKLNTDIGIECWLEIPNQKNQIREILDRLVKMNLCTANKRTALLDTICSLEVTQDIWSIHEPAAKVSDKHKVEILIREIKLLYSKSKGLSAKAYLDFERKVS